MTNYSPLPYLNLSPLPRYAIPQCVVPLLYNHFLITSLHLTFLSALFSPPALSLSLSFSPSSSPPPISLSLSLSLSLHLSIFSLPLSPSLCSCLLSLPPSLLFLLSSLSLSLSMFSASLSTSLDPCRKANGAGCGSGQDGVQHVL